MVEDRNRDFMTWSFNNITAGFIGGSIVGMGRAYYTVFPNQKYDLTKPFNLREGYKIIGKNTVHFTALTSLYCLGTVLANSFRGVDDAYNSCLGGAMAGAFASLRHGSVHTTFVTTICFTVLGGVDAYLSKKARHYVNDAQPK